MKEGKENIQVTFPYQLSLVRHTVQNINDTRPLKFSFLKYIKAALFCCNENHTNVIKQQIYLRHFKSQLLVAGLFGFFLQHNTQIICTGSKHSNLRKCMLQYNTEFLCMTSEYSFYLMLHFIFLQICTFVLPIAQMIRSTLGFFCLLILWKTGQHTTMALCLFGDLPLIQIVSIQFAFLSKQKETRTPPPIQHLLLLPTFFSALAALIDPS